MIRLKMGVRARELKPQTMLAIAVAAGVYESIGLDLWVTSLNDGTHMGGSKHYSGEAADLRTRGIREIGENPANIAAALKVALGPDYDVLHESVGTPNEHIHIEWDPD
jgi:hypothetical protein